MSFVLLIAAAAILGGVVAVAMGWGGEISLFARDIPELSWRPRTPYEVAMLRLPPGLLGYQRQATADALHEVAGLLADRDAEIARLADELSRFVPPVSAGPPERYEPSPEPPVLPASYGPSASYGPLASYGPPASPAAPLPMPLAVDASPPVASPPVASPPVASPPVASPPVASPSVASPSVASPSAASPSASPAGEVADIAPDVSDTTGVQA